MRSNSPDTADGLGRRGFIDLASRGLLWLTGGAAASALARYLTYQPPATPDRWLTLEHYDSYALGTTSLAADAGVAIFRQADGFYARSLTCRHLGCHVQQAEDGFACPCHGSRFDQQGELVSGPAPSDLDGLSLAYDSQGRLVLDRLTKVDRNWRLEPPAQLAGQPAAPRESEGS